MGHKPILKVVIEPGHEGWSVTVEYGGVNRGNDFYVAERLTFPADDRGQAVEIVRGLLAED